MNSILYDRRISSNLFKVTDDKETQIEFSTLLVNKSLNMLFQPIVNLNDGSLLGYEGLTRGPRGSRFHSPIDLFSYAEQCGSLYPLEKTARELAFQYSQSVIKKGQKLFININSQVIYDPGFTPGHTISLLKQQDLSPSNVVFEITERNAIQDFQAFKEVLNHYRAQGFKIAIDDAGAGYSSLQAITELMPDYIKVDRSLISGIHNNEVKMHILHAFVTLAKKTGSTIIAEGIETKEELQTVMQLGISVGQGYYLAYPDYPTKNIPVDVLQEIHQFNQKTMDNRASRKTIVAQIDDEIIIMEQDRVIKKSIINRLL
ncbi:EAL domain-containing protein [Cytobacillus sp. FJAT-54145]|uniref:EAL domain-containing protein n=1 Tax=Cytobacillus spartinae TaxID=3299023 RepID=A0ABW6K891_9BACI